MEESTWGQNRRGAVDEINAAHIAGSTEAAQITHNAAHGDQQIFSIHAKFQHGLQDLAVDFQAFAALALGDGVDGGILALAGHDFGVVGRHAGIRQHKDLAALHVGKLVEIGKAAGLQNNIVAAAF